jgi:hypothetical protein
MQRSAHGNGVGQKGIMTVTEFVRDRYFRKLCRDLKAQTGQCKITRARVAFLHSVESLPEKVNSPGAARFGCTQAELDKAHEMASFILSFVWSRWLIDDCYPDPMMHGSYGSRQ